MDYDRRDRLFYAAMSAIMLAVLLYVPTADPKYVMGHLYLGFVLVLMPLVVAYLSGWGK